MDIILAVALAFVVGCGCGYFLDGFFNDQVKKLRDKND